MIREAMRDWSCSYPPIEAEHFADVFTFRSDKIFQFGKTTRLDGFAILVVVETEVVTVVGEAVLTKSKVLLLTTHVTERLFPFLVREANEALIRGHLGNVDEDLA